MLEIDKDGMKKDLTITKKPIINKIKQPINSVINSGKKSNNILPKKTDIKETSSEIINKIIVLEKEIFLSLIPYVTPIPSESMLLEIAKIKQFISITIPPVYNMKKLCGEELCSSLFYLKEMVL